MKEFLSIKLDKNIGIPIYQQLGDALYVLIEEGILKPNAKLPPIRTMARSLRVNNVTVVNAYRYLENKKVVYSHIGSGTFVAEDFAGELPEPSGRGKVIRKALPYPREMPTMDAINFANSSTSTELFPVSEFKLIFNQVLDRDKGDAFSYQDSQGYEPLRRAICDYLIGYGIKTSAEKVQIISGAQQGIDIVSKVMLTMGDVLFVEKPTFYGAVGAFLSRGGQVVELPMENDGVDMDRLEALLKIYRPRFIYVMTYFQTPTCGCYSIEKKRRLLDLAYKYNTYILEEDNQSEFNYGDRQVTPLKAIDYKNRVIYIKSFSKILMPGLRLGFMVLPKKILQQVLSAKYTSDIATSGFIQRAFECYINSPAWENHILAMRSIFRERYRITREAIDKYLTAYVKYNPPEGGLSLWLELRSKKLSMEELCNRLVNKNVLVTPGAIFSMSSEDSPFFRLSFAAVEKDRIENGVRIIGETLAEMSDTV